MTITGRDMDARNGANDKAIAERGRAVDAAILAIEKQFGRGSIMKLGSAERQAVDSIPTGSIALDLALGVGGIPRGRITEIFGPESSGKTTSASTSSPRPSGAAGSPRSSTSSTPWIPGYARACGVNVDELLVSASRTPASRRSRSPRPSSARAAWTRRRGLGRGPRAARRDRRRDGRQLRRHPGPADEPGPAQAHRRRQPLEHGAGVHQPAAREDRRHVRQPGDDAGRPRAQVLRLGPAGHPARRDDQDRHGVGGQPGPRQGRQEQGRAAVPRCRVRRHVRRGHQPRKAACSTSASRWTSSPRPAPGSPSARRGSARAARLQGVPQGQSPSSPPRSSAASAPRCPRWPSRWRASRRPSRAPAPSMHDASGAGPAPVLVPQADARRTPGAAGRRSRTRPRSLDAAARFLEARPRSVGGPPPPAAAGYRPELVDGGIGRLGSSAPRRRGVRPRVGGVARPRAAARRACAPPRAQQKGRRPDADRRVLEERRASRGRRATRRARTSDDEAAERLLPGSATRRSRGCADPARRPAAAYALLARNGFDPEVASDEPPRRSASRRAIAGD